jgi:hypothetical protein
LMCSTFAANLSPSAFTAIFVLFACAASISHVCHFHAPVPQAAFVTAALSVNEEPKRFSNASLQGEWGCLGLKWHVLSVCIIRPFWAPVRTVLRKPRITSLLQHRHTINS